MNSISKNLVLILILIMVISGIIMVKPASAQTIPTPSVPEFSMSYTSSSIEVTILNQPFSPHQTAGGATLNLYYSVGEKEHSSDNWSYYPQYQGNYYPNGNYPATNSDYTVMHFGFNNSSSGPLTLNTILSGEQLDFQVQAAIGFYVTEPYFPPGQSYPPTSEGTVQVFSGYFSDWSPTQTLTIGETSASASPNPTPTSTIASPTPTPTIPEVPSWAIPFLFGLMMATAVCWSTTKKTNEVSQESLTESANCQF